VHHARHSLRARMAWQDPRRHADRRRSLQLARTRVDQPVDGCAGDYRYPVVGACFLRDEDQQARRMTKLRCAIYTRKSSDEGLDQDFNSLDAQHEACVAYIKSQASEGWKLICERYDD